MAIPASYSGTCEMCTQHIFEGDPIEHMDGYGWVHEECAE